ncbi:MAG: hypothetical protein NTZ85_03975 [Bacteroidia bacterium]|nr:hypothetical protein [Bacteroidia bacterium]
MKNRFITAYLIAAFLIPLVPVNCQTSTGNRDKYTLLTTPYNKRPLTLYKGQFQADAGYKFSLRSRSFDNNGDVIDLKTNGNASVMHNYFLELRYGVLNFVELGIESSYSKRGIRTESTTYGSAFSEVIVNELSEYKGLGDLYIYTSIRLPVQYTWFDFRVSGGFFLPTAKYKPDQPSNSISVDNTTSTFTIDYKYNNKNGYRVPVYQISAAAKVTFSKFAAYADFVFKDPLKEGTNIRWDETLSNYVFYYTSHEYDYLLDREMTTTASVHYQPVGWFDIHLKGSLLLSSKGWTEYWDNVRYKNPEIQLLTLEPGYEIQISPSLRLSQFAGFSLSGKSTDAPFYMITTLSYSIFPFLK